MNYFKLENMVKGWFVGHFAPTAYDTEACEVAIKQYKSGDSESAHYHKIATEITVILTGRVSMLGKEWQAGDIVVLSPGDIAAFTALEDSTTIVVKVPGATNDKYLVNR